MKYDVLQYRCYEYGRVKNIILYVVQYSFFFFLIFIFAGRLIEVSAEAIWLFIFGISRLTVQSSESGAVVLVAGPKKKKQSDGTQHTRCEWTG